MTAILLAALLVSPPAERWWWLFYRQEKAALRYYLYADGEATRSANSVAGLEQLLDDVQPGEWIRWSVFHDSEPQHLMPSDELRARITNWARRRGVVLQVPPDALELPAAATLRSFTQPRANAPGWVDIEIENRSAYRWRVWNVWFFSSTCYHAQLLFPAPITLGPFERFVHETPVRIDQLTYDNNCERRDRAQAGQIEIIRSR